MLKVQSIFSTIQGEGPHAGLPSVFIRLGGCNLSCSFCDTEFESFENLALDAIMQKVEEVSRGYKLNLAVITGGEPFRQTIGPLCELLIQKGFDVQIESNGTLYQRIPLDAKVVCSPKISGKKYHKIHVDILPHLIAYKFLISADIENYDQVPDLDIDKGLVYVQPMDQYDFHKNKANVELAIEICQKKGYKLSCQIHKYIGIE
ncbi:MAG: 7-carboxy-7-deazaguanine synthase QueE [Rickettsiaceae bacterium]|nr:7-carboxy-7-deazaguanine synthase QueE [Rickettsiaceae bacterium]